MSIELRVSTGARAGHRARFDGATITIGRDPLSDLHLDTERDLDVSARHAEIAVREGRHVLRDLGSTNGTFVNGIRVAAPREVRDGDVIMLGPEGPRIVVGFPDLAERAPASPGGKPSPLEAGTLRVPPRRPAGRLAIAAAAIGLAGIGVAYWLGVRESKAQSATVDALARRADSLRSAYDRDIGALSGRLAGLDTALMHARTESEQLRSKLRGEAAAGSASGSTALRSAERRHQGILSAAEVDYPAIAAENGPAVVLIAIEMADGKSYTGSGFGVSSDGLIVTNQHLLEAVDGASVRRIAVIYSDTRAWLPARVVRESADDDLALLRVERRGPFPTIAGVGRDVVPTVGAPVAVIGYPLGVDAPMDGTPDRMVARATLGAGMVSKVTGDIVQIDAFAGEGSSGSPVFDRTGAVIGVVFGGARDGAGRMVYAVPAARVAALLDGAQRGAER